MASQGVFQHTAARRRLARWSVSNGRRSSFNTQPPEGGWPTSDQRQSIQAMFQHTAARRRLGEPSSGADMAHPVSTHSRPKAAGSVSIPTTRRVRFQHTAARRRLAATGQAASTNASSFNTQPPEGGWGRLCPQYLERQGFNTQPPEGGWIPAPPTCAAQTTFQHTAARRRLAYADELTDLKPGVSTHSRPKAAGLVLMRFAFDSFLFQHTAARRRLGQNGRDRTGRLLFQHTAARRRLGICSKRKRPFNSFNTQPPEGGWMGRVLCHVFAQIVSTHSRPKAAGS